MFGSDGGGTGEITEIQILKVGSTSSTSSTQPSISAALDVTLDKKYRKLIVTISYFRSTSSYQRPSDIYLSRFSGCSEKLTDITDKYGKQIVGVSNGIAYNSFLVFDELDEGERVYIYAGYNLTGTSSSTMNKYLVVSLIGIN